MIPRTIRVDLHPRFQINVVRQQEPFHYTFHNVKLKMAEAAYSTHFHIPTVLALSTHISAPLSSWSCML